MILENNAAKKALKNIRNRKQEVGVMGIFYDGAARKWIVFEYNPDYSEYDQEEFNDYEEAMLWLN